MGMGIGTASVLCRRPGPPRLFRDQPGRGRFARTRFTFLADARGASEVRLGDARLSLEREREERGGGLRRLVGDAFNSDSVPMHLMTLECFRLYQAMLKPDGVLMVNISNSMLDLFPVVRALAAELGWSVVRIPSPADPVRGDLLATWVALTANRPSCSDP